MKKECTYVLLPTSSQTQIFIEKDGSAKTYKTPQRQSKSGGGHFLYILSDDEIKEGDWYVVELFKITGQSDGFYVEKVKKIEGEDVNGFSITQVRSKSNCKKIIGTTNPELLEKELNIHQIPSTVESVSESIVGVDKISQSDIEHIISLYNKKDDADKKWSDSDMMEFGLGVRNNDDRDPVSELFSDYKKHVNKTDHKEQPKSNTVMVEYEDNGREEWYGDDYNGQPFWIEDIKPKLKDGCIVIVRN